MRKIEEKMVEAIKSGKDFHSDNTSVIFSEHYGNPYLSCSVQLHGNTIAEFCRNGNLRLSDCGWQTVTTKSRLNVLLSEFVGREFGIFQKRGVWYLFGGEDQHEWDNVSKKFRIK